MEPEMELDLPSQEILRLTLKDTDNPPRRARVRNEKVTKYIDKVLEYSCDVCGKEFSDKYNLQTHSKIHLTTYAYQCSSCPYKCKIRKYLSRHVKKVHRKPTAHKCEVCGKMFHYKCGLNKHMLIHTGEKPYECEVCGKCFNSKYSLSTHKFIHTDQKPYKCSFCEYACRDSSTLRKHQAKHMGIQKVYQCKMCIKSYSSKWMLKNHVAEKHLEIEVKKYTCDQCGKIFKLRNNLTTHIQAVHEKSRRCKCKICGYQLSNRANLPSHMRRHVDARPYKCTFTGCSKSFKASSDLSKHVVIHTPSLHHECSMCGRLFARAHRRDKHMAQHEKKVKNVACDYCGVAFYNKIYLTTHIRRKHSDNKKKYICDLCDFVTYNKPSIVMHLKYGHGNEHDKQCRICKTVYKHHKYLKMHYLKTHNIRYKMIQKKKKIEDPVKIKEEPLDDISEHSIDLFEVDKQEVLDDLDDKNTILETEDIKEYSERVLSEDIAKIIIQNNSKKLKRVPEEVFDEFFIAQVLKQHVAVTKDKVVNVDKEEEKHMKECVKQLLNKHQKKIVRKRQITERNVMPTIESSAETNHEIGTKSDRTLIIERNDKVLNIEKTKSDKDLKSNETNSNIEELYNEEEDRTRTKMSNGSLKFNTHQCYICFNLFDTKSKLTQHCKDHFEICNEKMLKKCPICKYVTKSNLKRHMKTIHDIDINLARAKIKDRKDNTKGSRYCYEIDNGIVLEVIPSVKNLNKREIMKIDERNRKFKDKFVGTTKLVRKGSEWIVENKKIDQNEYVLPESMQDVEIDDYLDKMKVLSRIAKKNGKKMLFPCEKCEKKCQTLSALKLHNRKHESNPKPYKPKVWKHKMKDMLGFKEKIATKEKKVVVNKKNRLAKPKPIVNKHKCDEQLKEFYENNITGGDIEFWQFLKIYNKMGRENVKDFKDLEKRTDFGIHISETSNIKVKNNRNANKNKGKDKKLRKIIKNKKVVYKRVIMLSKKDYLKREAVKMRLREKISSGMHK